MSLANDIKTLDSIFAGDETNPAIALLDAGVIQTCGGVEHGAFTISRADGAGMALTT